MTANSLRVSFADRGSLLLVTAIHLAVVLGLLGWRSAAPVETPGAVMQASLIEASTSVPPPALVPAPVKPRSEPAAAPGPSAISEPAQETSAPSPETAAAGADAPSEAESEPLPADAGGHHNPKPRYPLSSRRLGEQGAVELLVRITPQGRAAEVRVRASSGFSRLDQSALETVLHQWNFAPPPREQWRTVTVIFKLES